MHEPFDWDRLDVAAYRVSMSRSVRRVGWVLAVIGVAVTVLGFVAPFAPFLVIGTLLACAGIWNVWRPAVSGLLVDGVTTILTGVFLSLLAWLWMEDARATHLAKTAVTSVLQVVWGVRRLMLYRTARQAVNDKPAIAHLEAKVRELSRRSARTDPSVVEFRTGRFGLQRNRFGLYPEGVVALLEQQVVRLDRRSVVWLEAHGTSSLGRSLTVHITMGDLRLMAQMSAEHFERFESWKAGMLQSAASHA